MYFLKNKDVEASFVDVETQHLHLNREAKGKQRKRSCYKEAH